MSAKELRAKAAGDLQAELIKLRREQFSLRMQAASGQTVKSSDFGKVKKSIARVKTVMTEKASSMKSGAGAKK
jgi:large subunit ribosomal protein L29